MSAQITTGIMTLADVPAVLAIEQACFTAPWSEQALVREMTENACARYVVAREDGEAIAYAGMWMVLDEAQITNVAVRADRRRMGVGETVMRALIQLAADSGMSWMTLEVRRSNAAAQRLYRKLGFIDVGFRKRYYDNQEDALIMALERLPEGNPENDPFLVRE